MTENRATDAFEALESYGELVAVMTGVKNQFIEAGWSWQAAELATMDIFRRLHSVDHER